MSMAGSATMANCDVPGHHHPADYLMSGGMLRGIKRRAESGVVPKSFGRSPLEDTNTAA
jgi:hypothetical protein